MTRTNGQTTGHGPACMARPPFTKRPAPVYDTPRRRAVATATVPKRRGRRVRATARETCVYAPGDERAAPSACAGARSSSARRLVQSRRDRLVRRAAWRVATDAADRTRQARVDMHVRFFAATEMPRPGPARGLRHAVCPAAHRTHPHNRAWVRSFCHFHRSARRADANVLGKFSWEASPAAARQMDMRSVSS
jgi:hypothetical protein